MLDTFYRKIEEETGISRKDCLDAELIGVYSSVYRERHCIEINFLVTVKNKPITLNREHSEYRWISKREACNLRQPLREQFEGYLTVGFFKET